MYRSLAARVTRPVTIGTDGVKERRKGSRQDISENGKYIVLNSKFISMKGEVKKYSETPICPLEYGEISMVMSDVPNGKALAKWFFYSRK
jgi:type I restriction enzyme S subunit